LYPSFFDFYEDFDSFNIIEYNALIKMEDYQMKRSLAWLFILLLLFLYACGNEKPVASFTVSKTAGCYPLSIAFDAGNSQDPDGDISSYSWIFGDNQTGAGKTINHTYLVQGSFIASLTVADDSDATATFSRTLTIGSIDGQWRGTATTITDRKPLDSFGVTMMISQTYADPAAVTGTAVWDHLPGVYFSGSGTLDTSNNILSMTWTATGFHSYTTIGNYTDDCHSFSGVIDGSSFTNDPFTMTWQSLIPTNEKIERAMVYPEGDLNVVQPEAGKK
jgi:PKD repeat protein